MGWPGPGLARARAWPGPWRALALACVAMQASTVWPCKSLLCGHAGLYCVAMQASTVWPGLLLCGHCLVEFSLECE